jgi:hypothetical protein
MNREGTETVKQRERIIVNEGGTFKINTSIRIWERMKKKGLTHKLIKNPMIEDLEIDKLAFDAWLEAKPGNIAMWNVPDDDPEAKFWREVWKKGFKTALKLLHHHDNRKGD